MNHQTAKIIAESYRKQVEEIWSQHVEDDEDRLQVARVRSMDDHAAVWERVAEGLLAPMPADLRPLVAALFANKSASIEDHFYAVREREGLGWDGPDMKAWGETINALKAAITPEATNEQ